MKQETGDKHAKDNTEVQETRHKTPRTRNHETRIEQL